jgi:uncharacterized membrane protein YfcA
MDLPTLATYSELVADRRFPAVIGIALLAGVVRGFSGFGSALTYIPLMSAVYGPVVAAPTFVLADLVTGSVFLARTWRRARGGGVVPLAPAAMSAAPFGAQILE